VTNRRLYFCHGYKPDDRPFNEHLWRLFLKSGFHSWIDTGLEKGWSGQPLPMDVSFNEWMMSRCAGFAAIIPQRESPYQRLEYRLAERMGLPKLVALQQGATFGAPAAETIELPTRWNLFWQDDKQRQLEHAIEHFAKRVDEQAKANHVLGSVGRWRPRIVSSELCVALLRPQARDDEWIKLQQLLQADPAVRWRAFSPGNLRSEIELVSTAGVNEFDLLVLDVGPAGTPRELVGYLHALGMPQIRVCRVSGNDEDKELGRHLEPSHARLPYERNDPEGSVRESLPRFLDGLKLDPEMEPVIFWRTAAELAGRLQKTIRRIEAFRTGLPPEEGGVAIEVSTHQGARQYFAQRYQQTERAYVFLSFAGNGAASQVPDRLAPILRFLNCRCFHYRDVDSHAESRLETGEYVETGLGLRLGQADVAVLLIDEKYVRSPYCMDELKVAVDLHNQGRLSLRAYALETAPKIPELKGLSIHVFRELNWPDSEIEQKIIDDVEVSVSALRQPLRGEERQQLLDWLDDDGGTEAGQVLELLKQSGVPEDELTKLDLNLNGNNSLFPLPESRAKHQRARELIALLVLAAAAGRPERLKVAIRWLSSRRLVGWPAPIDFPTEKVIELDEKPASVIGTVEEDQAVIIGQQLAQKAPEITAQGGPVCLVASKDALALPIEWARETADAEPMALRRPIRWRLPGVETRRCVHHLVSNREIPPTVLVLALAAADVEPTEETRQVTALLRDRYREMAWPPEFVRSAECKSGGDFLSRLNGCPDHVVHIAGHLGPDRVQVGNDPVMAECLATALNNSEVRLVVLNGCDGGTVKSPLAVEYLTLADRLVRDGHVSEIVAHRAKIAVSDALKFALSFYKVFFGKTGGFDAAQAVFQARKAGSARLRLSPVVISQR
jgi:hypothetical protein